MNSEKKEANEEADNYCPLCNRDDGKMTDYGCCEDCLWRVQQDEGDRLIKIR